ncbi:uncharacterized protein MONBRDRAFT_33456 [Monosiga brevicollis MX1]|uniref:Uncharacterized protein n=1 Tax=Monosiga brevicollis TaxID=81824 RepID=A9V5H5_MONBE|nr:uncharacterized protein MONBRDRAFT_33456 [Monosiga brevicollis MX1]EDQ87371.1 predicted protein [Monosiga brevicollis MX1]|eukprot:XP_001747984.1 hypothetical protein [Monosiga brevicollis MX1]
MLRASQLSKFVLALGMLYISGELPKALKGWTLADSIRAAGVPAIIYSCQNLLMLAGYAYLDGLTVNLINQTKTIFAAICVYLILGKAQSLIQCIALGGMFGASVLLTQQGQATSSGKPEVDYAHWLLGGVGPVFLASMLSGLASAITQMNLQKRQRNSLLFTMELGVYSSIALLVKLLLSNDLQAAAGGIVVGLVVKYAGSVRKGFAILAGIVITGLADFLVAGNPLSTAKLVALPLVVVCTYLHMAFPAKAPTPSAKTKKAD